jgi:SAM-dependent methyltransferase
MILLQMSGSPVQKLTSWFGANRIRLVDLIEGFVSFRSIFVEVQRPEITRSSRLTVTRRLVARSGAASVLEIGGGDLSFRDALPDAKWTMIDFAGKADVVFDLNVPQPKIPLPCAQFDFVIMTEVMEHLLWPHRLLQEIRRLLKESGQILVSVPNVNSATYRLAWLMGRIPSCAACGNLPPPEIGPTTYLVPGGTEIGGHVIDFNRQRLVQLFRFAGFAKPQFFSSGLIWHRQIVPPGLCPVTLASNLIALVRPLPPTLNS